MVRFAEPAGLYPDFRMSCPVRPLLLLQLVADPHQQQLLRGHRGRLPAHPHLVPGRRGAVLPGLAPGGPGGDAPGPHLRPGHAGPVGAVDGRGGGLGRRDGPALQPRRPTPPGSTSAPTPTPSPSWSGRCLACVHDHDPDAPGGRGDGPGPGRRGPGGPRRRSAWPAWPAPSPSPTPWRGPRRSTTGAGSSSPPCRRRPSSSARCACRRGRSPGPVPATPGVAGHHLLRRLPLALPGLHLPRLGPDRAHRPLAAGRPVRLPPSPWPRPATTWSSGRSWTGRSGGRSRPSSRPLALIGATVAVIIAGTVVPATAAVRVRIGFRADRPATGRPAERGGARRQHGVDLGGSAGRHRPVGHEVVQGGLFGCGLAIAAMPRTSHPSRSSTCPRLATRRHRRRASGRPWTPATVAGTNRGDVVLFIAGDWEAQDLLRTEVDTTSPPSFQRYELTRCARRWHRDRPRCPLRLHHHAGHGRRRQSTTRGRSREDSPDRRQIYDRLIPKWPTSSRTR